MMNNYFIILLISIKLCVSNFTLWDHCKRTSTNCDLDTVLYSYGSAYDSNTYKWYLVAGNTPPLTSNITVITLPNFSKDIDFTCDIYPQSLPQIFSQNNAAIINNVLYSFGGFNNTFMYLDDVYKSTITTTTPFVDAASPPIPFSAACSVTISTKVYIIGGLTDRITNNELPTLDTLYEYNSLSNMWIKLNSMNIDRFAPGCEYYNNTIYVFGGETRNFTELASIEMYNIDTNIWSMSNAVLSYSAHWISASYLNVLNRNLILVMGGIAGFYNDFDTIDVYDIDLDSIIQTTNMLNKRYAFQSITPYHGDWARNIILFGGGKNVNTSFKTIEGINCSVSINNYSNDTFKCKPINCNIILLLFITLLLFF